MIDATGSGEDTYYYHRNRRFSIIGLTDDTGTVIEHYAYTAYGEVTILAPDGTTVRTTSDVGNPYTYTGRRLDDETGLLYFRARYHDPVLGRFLERDPLGYPDGLNTYAAHYVMWGGVDPYGLKRGDWEYYGPWYFRLTAQRPSGNQKQRKITRIDGVTQLGLYINAMAEGCPCQCTYRVQRAQRRAYTVQTGRGSQRKTETRTEYRIIQGNYPIPYSGVFVKVPGKDELICTCAFSREENLDNQVLTLDEIDDYTRGKRHGIEITLWVKDSSKAEYDFVPKWRQDLNAYWDAVEKTLTQEELEETLKKRKRYDENRMQRMPPGVDNIYVPLDRDGVLP